MESSEGRERVFEGNPQPAFGWVGWSSKDLIIVSRSVRLTSCQREGAEKRKSMNTRVEDEVVLCVFGGDKKSFVDFTFSLAKFSEGSLPMNQRTPKLLTISLVLAGTILAGCNKQAGSDPKAEVDQSNPQLTELQGKLATAEKAAELGKAEIGAAAAAGEASKRELAARDLALSQKDEQIRTLQTELAALRKSEGLVFGQIGDLRQKGESATALERYEKFIVDYPESPLVADANRAIADLKPTVEKDSKWKTSLIDPRREERELLKRFAEGIVTPQELAPLLRQRTASEVINLLGRPGRSFRNGSEYGYTDKIIDTATGNRETLVIRFEAGRVEGLRAGYQGREIKP